MSDIRLSGITVRFGKSVVLHDISLSVDPGEWLGLVGPNGAGKTTLLHVIAGLLPHEGSVFIGRATTREMTQRQRAQEVALVPQRPTFPEGMSVADYVLLGRTPHIGYFDLETGADRAIAMHSLDRLGIVKFAGRSLRSLSGGEQQRVVLARALAQQASVLLLDEGTSALDIGAQQEVLDLVDDLRASEGLTVISAMHDLMLAAQYPDRLALLSRGRVIASEKPQEVLTSDLIADHFGARVSVTQDLDGIVIRPVRERASRQGACR